MRLRMKVAAAAASTALAAGTGALMAAGPAFAGNGPTSCSTSAAGQGNYCTAGPVTIQATIGETVTLSGLTSTVTLTGNPQSGSPGTGSAGSWVAPSGGATGTEQYTVVTNDQAGYGLALLLSLGANCPAADATVGCLDGTNAPVADSISNNLLSMSDSGNPEEPGNIGSEAAQNGFGALIPFDGGSHATSGDTRTDTWNLAGVPVTQAADTYGESFTYAVYGN